MSAPERPLLAGKYELFEVAGTGGMATVYRAVMHGPSGFSRPVAIKKMLPRLGNDPHFVALFVEEARVCSQLQHANVVQITDFGVDDVGSYYLVMEWVDGLDLLDYALSFQKSGYYTPWAAIATIGLEVLKGLHAAHHHIDPTGAAAPIFHRDVTPHNILLGINGTVKLTDFGLARAADRGTMTLPHVVKGKISYTAPEMTRGVKANPRTDIFSLGVTLWEALSGRKMFDGPNTLQIIKQMQEWAVPPLGSLRRDLPPGLVDVVTRAIARDPQVRYASAMQMLMALTAVVPPMPDLSRLGASIAEARRRLRHAEAPESEAPLEELGPGEEVGSPAGPLLKDRVPEEISLLFDVEPATVPRAGPPKAGPPGPPPPAPPRPPPRAQPPRPPPARPGSRPDDRAPEPPGPRRKP